MSERMKKVDQKGGKRGIVDVGNPGKLKETELRQGWL